MALTDAAKVKAYLGETGSGLDSILAALIPRVEARILTHLGRTRLESGAVTDEVHDGDDCREAIVLREWPATAVSSVTENGETLSASDYDLDVTRGRLYRLPSGLTYSPGPWSCGRRNLVVSYTAGYATLPEDLVSAATVQVAWDVKRTGHKGGRLGERTQTVGDGTATYMVDEWAPEVLSMLAPYRSVRV